MKTTIELPDDLVIAAKKKAAETRTSLRAILERALRRELAQPENGRRAVRRRKLRLLVVDGGLPPGLDVSNREKMYEWFDRQRESTRGMHDRP